MWVFLGFCEFEEDFEEMLFEVDEEIRVIEDEVGDLVSE